MAHAWGLSGAVWGGAGSLEIVSIAEPEAPSHARPRLRRARAHRDVPPVNPGRFDTVHVPGKEVYALTMQVANHEADDETVEAYLRSRMEARQIIFDLRPLGSERGRDRRSSDPQKVQLDRTLLTSRRYRAPLTRRSRRTDKSTSP